MSRRGLAACGCEIKPGDTCAGKVSGFRCQVSGKAFQGTFTLTLSRRARAVVAVALLRREDFVFVFRGKAHDFRYPMGTCGVVEDGQGAGSRRHAVADFQKESFLSGGRDETQHPRWLVGCIFECVGRVGRDVYCRTDAGCRVGAAKGQLDLAFEDVKHLVEVVAVRRGPAARWNEHVDEREAATGLLAGDQDCVDVAKYGDVRQPGVDFRLRDCDVSRRVVVGQHGLAEAELHRPEFAFEGVEDEAEVFERDHAQQRIVAGLAEDDGRVAVVTVQGDVTFGYLSLYLRAVRQCEACRFLGLQLDRFPYFRWKQGVRRTAIDHQLELLRFPGGAGDGDFDVG
jgi:hypothetical protein